MRVATSLCNSFRINGVRERCIRELDPQTRIVRIMPAKVAVNFTWGSSKPGCTNLNIEKIVRFKNTGSVHLDLHLHKNGICITQHPVSSRQRLSVHCVEGQCEAW